MRKYIGCAFLLILIACEQVVEINVPNGGARITLNAEGNPDSLWTATVSLNRYVLDTAKIKMIENALIVIYDNELSVDTLTHLSSGTYSSDTGKPIAGHSYTLRVAAGNYGSVSGKTTVPLPATLLKATMTDNVTADGSKVISVSAQFSDDANAVNYYQIIVTVSSQYLDGSSGEVKEETSPIGTLYNEAPLSPLADDKWAGEGLLIKDILFNGGVGEVTFNLGPNYSSVCSIGSVNIILKTLSEEDYKYMSTADLQSSLTGDPFAEPVNVYNNIENGFGIVASYSQSGIIKSNPRPVITSVTPAQGKAGDHIIIKGENLIDAGGRAIVSFSRSAYVEAIKSNANEVEVIVPEFAETGKLSVRNTGWVDAVDFEVIK